MKTLSVVLGLFIMSALSMTLVTALEANDTEYANITVSVATKTMVDINPAVFEWLGLNPGSTGGSSQETNGYGSIQVENIGSHNITHIWFNATYPSSRPFATGSNESYDTGNFVVLAKEGTNNYFFPNRKEYNESRSLVYLKDPGGNMPPSGYSYGRFRNSSYEYFWMVQFTNDCVGETFYIGDQPHTETQTGTTDFQSGDFTSGTLSAATSGWCYVDLPSPWNDYTIYVKNQTLDEVIFYHWNKDIPAGNNVEYFWDAGGNPGIPLVPGNSTVIDIMVYIPYGVYEGYIKQGKLEVVVNDI